MPQNARQNLVSETSLLDFNSPAIQTLIKNRHWKTLRTYERIGAAYDFVRDEIRFGYNEMDTLRASQVLKQGFGQCNTKAILLMALFRSLNIPCRLHGFTIKKSLQRGVIPELIYPITPPNILHSWVEIFYENTWISLEGFILDTAYLTALQAKFNTTTSLCKYGAGTDTLNAPNVNWCGRDTYIQKTGINADFGIFDDPDSFYNLHQQNMSFLTHILYKFIIRHWMNVRVEKFRAGKL